MRVRSLPHFSHKPIGKTTHKKGMSYAHVNYITRDDACSKTLAENMPADREGARPYFEREAYKDGIAANARVADTLIIALPIELTKAQRHAAVAGFMEKIGHGRIAWLAAFHDLGKDEHNPHCHLIFRDADIETGRKIVGTTTSAKDVREAQEHGWRVPPRMTTKDLRIAWCEHLNSEMERHGIDVRFDQRRLKDQGIDREPEIHVGPKANSMSEKDRTFFSQDRRRGDHANPYTLLDTGSRAEHNERIKETNRQREAEKRDGQVRGVPQPHMGEGKEKSALRDKQSAERKAMYQEQMRDRAALRAAQDAQKLEHQKWGRALYAEARERAFQKTKAATAKRWERVRQIKNPERRDVAAEALKMRQKEAYENSAEQEINKARPVKDQSWQTMKLTQETERKELQGRHGEEASALSRQQIAERYALHEKWQHHHLTTQATRVSAKLEAHQGMASVQSNAIAMIKLHAKTQRGNTRGEQAPAAVNSLEASKLFAERGRAESATREALRNKLNVDRRLNTMRAAPNQTRQTTRGHPAGTRTNRAAQSPRDVVRQQADAQSAIRQSVLSGRSLSSADKASASPDAKSAILANEKTARSRSDTSFLKFITQRSGKGRTGGRSGR